ncbi:MAG: GntR family transcriptional regulator [Phycisphaerae bacterium]
MAILPTSDPFRAPATTQVAALLRQRVRTGGFSIGDVLPAERKLAESIGVARNTLRAALQQLEEEGVISQEGYRRRVRSLPPVPQGLLSGTVGILALRRESGTSHRAPGWESFVEVGAMQQAREFRLNALVLHAEALVLPQAVEELLAQPPRGIVVCSGAYRNPQVMEVIRRFRAVGLPLVAEGDPPGTEHLRRVVSDHAAGAAMLTRLIIERGRSRIVYLLPRAEDRQYWVRRRIEGYQRAMAEAGLQPIEPILTGPMIENTGDPERFEVAVMQMLGYLVDHHRRFGGIDALLTASDAQVCIAAAALRKLGLVPQKDVLIAGYDNFWSELPERAFEDTVPFATVDKDNMAIGRKLVSILMEPDSSGGPTAVEVVRPRLVLPAGVAAGDDS